MLERYLEDEMQPALEALGFTLPRPHACEGAAARSSIAERIEDRASPTVLGYGHGDVIRGLEAALEGRPLAVAADRARRPLLRARHRRQQGPAHDQHRRAGGGARRRAAGSASTPNG